MTLTGALPSQTPTPAPTKENTVGRADHIKCNGYSEQIQWKGGDSTLQNGWNEQTK